MIKKILLASAIALAPVAAFAGVTGGVGVSGGTGQNSLNTGNGVGNTHSSVSGNGNGNIHATEKTVTVSKSISTAAISQVTATGPATLDIELHQ